MADRSSKHYSLAAIGRAGRFEILIDKLIASDSYRTSLMR